LVLGDFGPDLTLVLDLPVEQGLQRAKSRPAAAGAAAEDRYERMGTAFHETLRRAFHDIAVREPQRCRIVDASGSPDAVADALWTAVADRFGLSGGKAP